MNSPANHHAVSNTKMERNNKKKARKPARKSGNTQPTQKGVAVSYAPRNKMLAARLTKGNYNPRSIRVAHREWMGEVVGTTAFAAGAQCHINPGMRFPFQWLAPIANQYESYRFTKLKFVFRSQKPTSTAGKIMLYVDYDAYDVAPVTKSQFMNNSGAVDGPVWQELTYNCDLMDVNRLGKTRFVRSGVIANADLNNFDVGNLVVGTDACADTSVLGDIYVDYAVELITPHCDPLSNLNGETAKITFGGAMAPGSPLGSAPTITGGLPITVENGKKITFNAPGEYLLDAEVGGSVFTNASWFDAGTAAAVIPLTSVFNAAATSLLARYLVRTTLPGQYVNFDGTGKGNTVTSGAIRLADYLLSIS